MLKSWIFSSLHGPLQTVKMNGNDVNLLEMSYDDINSMRKKDLMEQIEKIKVKLFFDSHVKDFCNQTEKLTDV